MKIRISSDSTCDLNREYLEEHGVTLVTLYTNMGEDTYRDGIDITPADIFAHVAAGGELCSTTANNVADYDWVFTELLKECDAVVHINIGAEFSCCHQNAKVAAAEFPGKVFVVDSRNLTTGQGLLVCEAVQMAESGEYSPQEIAERLNALTDKVDASFLLGALDYIVKGGRCSPVAALGANLLRLKPCIELKDGKMVVGKKYRGSYEKCAVDYIKEKLSGREDIDYSRIFFVHTAISQELIALVMAEIARTAPFAEIIETTAGCTISCHCGPETLGLSFFKK